jgi:hypothetical protein
VGRFRTTEFVLDGIALLGAPLRVFDYQDDAVRLVTGAKRILALVSERKTVAEAERSASVDSARTRSYLAKVRRTNVEA